MLNLTDSCPQADVLVNPIVKANKCLDKAGLVSAAISTAGGPDLQKVLFSFVILESVHHLSMTEKVFGTAIIKRNDERS